MESMVEDINNILNTGEVPNLFAADEVSMIQEALVPRAREIGISDAGPGGLWRT
jgi:dynein heavy chain